MRYFVLGSLLFCCFLTACVQIKNSVPNEKKSATIFWSTDLMDTATQNHFRLTIKAPNTNITGICAVKRINGEWKGTVFNEFGVKVFDFISTAKKCELLNVITFLDKWYLKKIIASDLQFIMEIDNPNYLYRVHTKRYFEGHNLVVNFNKRKELVRLPDGVIQLKNTKYKLCYTLRKFYESTNQLLQNN